MRSILKLEKSYFTNTFIKGSKALVTTNILKTYLLKVKQSILFFTSLTNKELTTNTYEFFTTSSLLLILITAVLLL